MLAERALVPVLPSREEFPYAIRQVSEALGSNGSTSMGSVCASTLSMLNAGVPLRAPVAGIAMGLISDTVNGETRYAALTDILGAEDAFGDMDFKVAGTGEFITAIQLDTKLDGLPTSVLTGALSQAHEARLAILGVLGEAIDAPDEMSPHAPRVLAVTVPVDKIGAVIGPKGQMINKIQDDTGADITIEDDGTVYIGATDGPSAEAARSAVNAIANPMVPEDRRALPRHRRARGRLRRLHLADPGQGRTAPRHPAAQAERRQAGRERRGCRQGRSEGRGGDPRGRRPRKDLPRRVPRTTTADSSEENSAERQLAADSGRHPRTGRPPRSASPFCGHHRLVPAPRSLGGEGASYRGGRAAMRPPEATPHRPDPVEQSIDAFSTSSSTIPPPT